MTASSAVESLEADRYLLFVSRLEPENNAHLVIEAYQRAGGQESLGGVAAVVVGHAPYATDFKAALETLPPRYRAS
jgi:glycosyltransferase involved in cell wall biosynthesis